jgi:hypothetical protein
MALNNEILATKVMSIQANREFRKQLKISLNSLA